MHKGTNDTAEQRHQWQLNKHSKSYGPGNKPSKPCWTPEQTMQPPAAEQSLGLAVLSSGRWEHPTQEQAGATLPSTSRGSPNLASAQLTQTQPKHYHSQPRAQNHGVSGRSPSQGSKLRARVKLGLRLCWMDDENRASDRDRGTKQGQQSQSRAYRNQGSPAEKGGYPKSVHRRVPGIGPPHQRR